MRDSWIRTFTEMEKHMKPEPVDDALGAIRTQMGFRDKFLDEAGDDDMDEDSQEQGDSPRQLYMARCINGMVRNRASKNAACNCQFQSVVAAGAKMAGWKLLYEGGLDDRLCAFIHDEYLYCLWPEEMDTAIPRIESLMVEGMRTEIPDVKVGVETSCSYHWNKGATVFQELKRDGDGRYVIDEPELIAEIYDRHRGSLS